jgi:hypothetical protein
MARQCSQKGTEQGREMCRGGPCIRQGNAERKAGRRKAVWRAGQGSPHDAVSAHGGEEIRERLFAAECDAQCRPVLIAGHCVKQGSA